MNNAVEAEQAVETQATENYTLKLSGGQPLDVLKEFVTEQKELGKFHPIMNSKRYELVSLNDRLPVDKFAEEYLRHNGEENVIYVAILRLGTTTEYKEIHGPTGKVKKNEVINKGARKWEKFHVVYTVADNEAELSEQASKEVDKFVTKGEAMTFARELALRSGAKVWIELEDRLVNSQSRIATFEPEVGVTHEATEVPNNNFLFFGKGSGSA